MRERARYNKTNSGRQRSTGGNSEYVAIDGEVANRRSVLLKKLCAKRIGKCF